MPDRRFVVADAHCDSITRLTPLDLALGCAGNEAHLDLARLGGRVKLQFMAFFLHQAPPEQAWRDLRRLRHNLQLAVELHGGLELLLERSRAGRGGHTQLVLAVEGLDLLARDGAGFVASAEELYRLGFRSLGLFWNNNNFLGCGADAVGAADTGLTAAGRDFIAYAERRGFWLDLAHASANSFWQAAAATRQPLFVSHACCAAICPHRRNLTDAQLRALGQSGGWLGITFAPGFLRSGQLEGQPVRAGLADVVRHVKHAVNLAGEEAVGFGSDFDGVERLPQGIAGVQSWPEVAEALTAAGFSETMTERLLGGNLLRFLHES